MDTQEVDKFIMSLRDTLKVEDRTLFDIYTMKFKGNNYPLCEEEMKKMVYVITENGENNMEKFIAFGALFFALFDKFIQSGHKDLNG
jgi:hypothetical protein